MNKKALTTLEFDKIIARLKTFAGSASGADLCARLQPMTDLTEIQTAQEETGAAVARILRDGSLGFYGIHDIRGSLKRLSVQSVLSPKELLSIASLLDNTKRIKAYASSEREDITSDILSPMFDSLEPVVHLANRIHACIVSEEEIADDASPELSKIRKAIKNASEKIRAQLNKLVNDSSMRGYLQDSVVTTREGRYCLPIKAEYRSNVPGLIHDQSGSGSTVFIEPMIIVKLNNDIRDLESEEKEEIEKILQELSIETAEYTGALDSNFKTLIRLDFIFAKAAFALSYNGSAPRFNTNGYIRLLNARHPLLDQKTVVPITLELGGKYHQLIITGPNTGGKTVSLKTVGLLTLMGQAGLHIPAKENSKLAVFHKVFADIGDEQSIEQSLSTFSAHMTNIVSIIRHADDRSLVLFDELGAGTDPTEGAALAVAILTFLGNMKVRTMATTHYAELKAYALGTEGVENACCEFNIETLRPTYKLLTGIPGKSNAFAISKKLGLPEFIIDNAREHLSSQDISFEDLLADLEQKRLRIEKEELEIAEKSAKIQVLNSKLEDKNRRLEEQRDRIIKEAKNEAYEILEKAKEYADDTIKKFSKYSADSLNRKEMEMERSALRENMKQHQTETLSKEKAKASKKTEKADLVAGAKVRVLSFGMDGTIIVPPNNRGEATVQMGSLTTSVKIKDLEFLSAPEKETVSKGYYSMGKAISISPEINLIGQTIADATEKLSKYIDDAYLAHLSSIRIVHGKGSGALRQGVQQYLHRHPLIKSYRLGEFGEGDSGVTIAEFK